MTPDPPGSTEYDREELRQLLRERVGGFFTNTRHLPGQTCTVCAGPATGELCRTCRNARRAFGAQLADRVLTLAYVQGHAHPRHQSAHTMRSYKERPPVTKSVKDLSLMVLAATALHGDCIARPAGRPWSAVTFVPSTHHPVDRHPLAELARQVCPIRPDQRFLLDLGPRAHDKTRTVLPDRFTVPDRYRPLVAGAHVLILDDTWVSGSNAQSAALAVRAAGADQVTVLCIGRWCPTDRPESRALLAASATPYDPTVCPAGEGACLP
jgi:hypothetical protein